MTNPSIPLRLAAMLALATLAGCAQEAAHPTSGPPQGASAGNTSSAGSASAAACPVTPMKLVLEQRGGADGGLRETVALELKADGQILLTPEQADPSHPAPPVALRQPGCIDLGPHLMIELLPDGRLWQRLAGHDVRLEGAAMRGPAGTATIEPDGRITTPKPSPVPLRLDGYRPGYECAGALLVNFWFGTFPSDNVEEKQPDATSRCASPPPR